MISMYISQLLNTTQKHTHKPKLISLTVGSVTIAYVINHKKKHCGFVAFRIYKNLEQGA
jgi:hypothetical protein